jgi:hypothetical protein
MTQRQLPKQARSFHAFDDVIEENTQHVESHAKIEGFCYAA